MGVLLLKYTAQYRKCSLFSVQNLGIELFLPRDIELGKIRQQFLVVEKP